MHMSPLLPAGFVHVPVAGVQVPATWHSSKGVQVTGLEPVQLPPWQVSVWVHMLLSLQGSPLGLAGFEHIPFAGLQVPAMWH
jgi:hypothetical protein